MKKFKLRSIIEEAAACRKAFKNVKKGAFVLHCHHELLGETLTEEAENRISYILKSKSEHEQALRLRLFRPISKIQLGKFKKAYADWQKAYADWQKVHAALLRPFPDFAVNRQKVYADRQKRQKAYDDWKETYANLIILIHSEICYSNCPWDGKTIFP